MSSGLSRRELITGSAGLAGGAVAAGLGLAATAPAGPPARGAASTEPSCTAVGDRSSAVEPFYGLHQSGIATRPQLVAAFVGLDLRPDTRHPQLVRLLRLLTDDAARLTQGRPALADTEPELAADPARLTVTLGLGPGAFDAAGAGDRRPASVRPLPAFRTDALQQTWGQCDLLLQVCTDSPVTLVHTVRMLVKDARRFTTVRWIQEGFTTPGPGTPRNLMGQVDGSANPPAGSAEFEAAVWAREPAWFAGGTVLVLRRIRMDLEGWDAFERPGKEQVIGRRLDTGAPLTGSVEQDVPDLHATDAAGFPVIEPNAHIRLAHQGPSETMLRRPYSYAAGMDGEGRLDAGLLFAVYQADADAAFVPVQRRLAASDLFNRWITHIGSAVFAVPPGAAEGGYLGQGLLEA